MMNRPRIAICFFGITRSLGYTIASIKENIVGPAKGSGDCRVFAHFFSEREIDNPRSGERGALPTNEHLLLSPDWLEIEEPNGCLKRRAFEKLKVYGDAWNDDYRSLRNLVHQLHSLDKVTAASLAWEPDIFIFARPDLLYHDNVLNSIRQLAGTTGNQDLCIVPNWQCGFDGYNDRFALCGSAKAAEVYGCRINFAEHYVETMKQPLVSEKLLKFALSTNGIRVDTRKLRASRVRVNGIIKNEIFIPWTVHRLFLTALRTKKRIIKIFGD